MDWERLHETLEKKPDMYKVWLSKQHSNFCGTRLQVARYANIPNTDTRCPNCLALDERASHLCICPDEGRTRLFIEDVNKLEEWLTTNNNTNAELAYWLPKYILYRGTKKFTDMGLVSPRMRAIATSQDTIGWHNFMEGRVSNKLYLTQHLHQQPLLHS